MSSFHSKTRYSQKLTGLALGGLLALFSHSTWACSDFMLVGAQPILIGALRPVVSARTLDFPADLGNKFIMVPRGVKWKSRAPFDKPGATNDDQFGKPEDWRGVSWTNQYGFIGLNAPTMFPRTPWTFFDGINEVGLSSGSSWMTDTKYPRPNDKDILDKKALSNLDFIAWVLGNFKTVAEVKAALQANKVVVWGEEAKIPKQSDPTHFDNEHSDSIAIPAHVMLHDATGESLVIEFTGDSKDENAPGVIRFYDRTTNKDFVDVLTNSPSYPEQLKNLETYKEQVCGFRTEKDPNLQKGSTNYIEGLKGIPGDMSRMSRFVTLAKVSKCTMSDWDKSENSRMKIVPVEDNPLKTEDDAVQTAWKVIARAERPRNESADPMEIDVASVLKLIGLDWDLDLKLNVFPMEWNLLTLVRVHAPKSEITDKSMSKIYFRSADNQSIRLIDLGQLDFGKSDVKTPDKLHTFWEADESRYTKAQDVTSLSKSTP